MKKNIIKDASYVAVAASAVVASSVYVYSTIIRDNKVPTPIDKTAIVTTTPISTITASAYKYKDGDYTGKGDYATNNGAIQHKMEVSVTLEKDMVTAASTKLVDATVSDSAKTSNTKFNEELKKVVVGKKVNTIATLGKISGSSDTTTGFKAGVEAILVEAAY
jgi:hypothetical protein